MHPPDPSTEAAWLRAMLSALRTLAAQREPAAAARVVAELLLDHVADRAVCLLHDPDSASLWSPEDGREVAPGEGLVTHVAATGVPLCLARADVDPRHRPAVDDPEVDTPARLLLQPIAEPGGPVHAVLVLARDLSRPAFTAEDRRRVAELARRAAPLFDQLALQQQLDVDATSTDPGLGADGPYRAEALAAHAGWRQRGDVVRADPATVAWSYRALVVLLIAGLAYIALARVGDHASGPAIVRLGGRAEVRAVADGSVAEVLVRPGQRVVAGQPLVHMHDVAEAAELRRLQQEFEFQLRELLRDPDDAQARRAVAGLRAEQARAAARSQEQVARAPQAGVVADVRAQVGQALVAGDVLVALAGDDPAPHLVALLPGDQRPRLRVGMPLRLELDGYADVAEPALVERIDADVVSPAEALRLLGPAVGGGLDLPGPVVRVHARLPASFASRGGSYAFHDGMRGRAEVRVRTISLLEALVPALERL